MWENSINEKPKNCKYQTLGKEMWKSGWYNLFRSIDFLLGDEK